MHRLRDLDRRGRLVAAAMVVLLLVPVGASLARAWHVGWLPSGDDALIGLRTHDVFTSDRPLIGQPSTSHLYGPEEGTSHPGPIEFYWLAVPFRALGPSVGMIVGIAIVQAGAVLVAAWVAFRRAGPAVGAWAAVLLSLLLWAEGTAILSDPISSNAGGIPLVALAALTWAVLDGDLRLLPLTALVASWVAQQHLAIVVPSGALVGAATVGATVHVVVRWRARRAARSHEVPADEVTGRDAVSPAEHVGADAAGADGATPVEAPVTEDRGAAVADRPPLPVAGPPASWPWVVGALGVVLLCWLPVLWQQATGHPGNITAVLTYARESEAEPLGAVAGLRQAARAVGVPPLLTRSDLTGREFFAGPLGPGEVAAAVAAYAVLLGAAVLGWRRSRTLALAATTALVLAAGGAYNGSTIPDSIEAFRINFYRWPFVVAWLAWIVFGWLAAWAGAWLADRYQPAWTGAVRRAAPALAVAVMVLPAVGAVATAGYNDERRDQSGFGAMRELADDAVAVADERGADDVTLVLRGRSSVLATGPAVAVQLEAAGHPVTVPEVEARFWGDQRILTAGEEPGDLILQVVSGRGSVPEGPGRVVRRVDLNEHLRQVLDPLVEAARTAPVEVSDRGSRMLLDRYEPGPREYVEGLLASIDTEPERVLTDPALLDLIIDGYYASPTFDADQLEALRAELPATTVNDDDVFELRVLTPDELVEVVPELGKE